ncbi:hypothetical protein GmHk_20G057636 [Glycine max]|nr:hypothetical protein JHK85_056550 [Glycine max]KAH1189972.1 hypothetical protein GmHk_20G057636 [Glycine max]
MILVKLVKLAFVTGIWPMHGSTKYRNASRMLGDQLALASVEMSKPHFGTSKFAKALAFSEDIGGSSILFLPCSMYKWTLPEGAGQFHGMPLDVKIYATHQLEFLEVADLILESCRKAESTPNNLWEHLLFYLLVAPSSYWEGLF